MAFPVRQQWSQQVRGGDGRIAEAFGIDPVTARILLNRGICEEDQIRRFLYGTLEDLEDPGLYTVKTVLLRDGKAELVKSRGSFVLAGLEDTLYQEKQLQLQEGDLLFLYTDGVTEATTKDKQLYGEQRLLDCLAGCSELDVQAMLERVKRSVDDFVQDNEQFDDMTMLCVKWK